MPLLSGQTNVSPQRGLPVDDTGQSSAVVSITGETVQLFYYNGSDVLTSDAGQAIGVAVVAQLAYENVKNALGSMTGSKLDTSLSFTSTALTTEVDIDWSIVNSVDRSSGVNRLTAIVAGFSNGDYCVDYSTGTIYGKKASTTTTLTSAAYKIASGVTAPSAAASVSVTSVVPGTSATNLGKAEDAAHSSGDVGVMALAVQKATPADLGADGDYAPLQVSAGRAWVSAAVTSSALPTGAATEATLAAADTKLGTIDTDTGNIATNTTDLPNVIGTDGAAGPTKVLSIGGTQATGEIQEVQVDADGQLQVDVLTSALPTGAATQATLATLALETGGNLAAAAASLAAIDTDTSTIITNTTDLPNVIGTDGAAGPTKVLSIGGTQSTGEIQEVQVDADGQLQVDVLSSALPTGAATETSVAASATSLAVMDDWDNAASDGASVSGDVASDSPDAGEPVKVGYKAYAFDGTTPQTAVAEADRVNAIADLQGIQFVQTSHPAFWHATADYSGAQTNASVKTAPGAGSLYITDIFLSNGATAGNVTLLDGSGGTVLWEAYPGINGGAVCNLRNPIKLSATTALCLTSTTVTTHSVTICGFTA